MPLIRWVIVGLGLAAVALTALPLVDSNEALIRIWDFPRLQLAVALLVILVAALVALPLRRKATLIFLVMVALAMSWQAYRIWPYTPAYPIQAVGTASCPENSRLRLLVANVLVDNENAEPLLEVVDTTQPDVVLLIETNARWDRQLEPLAASHTQVIAYPQESGYGLHLFSRLDLIDPQIRFLVEDDVPSIKTGVLLPSGERVNLYGLHPKPPPLQDTDERDAELLIVAKEAAADATPSVVAGDLNDVAWSSTTQLFQEIGGLLDPRIGRGPLPTFPADWPLLQWPLDHAFFEETFRLLEIAVMPNVGSDHFPLFISLCHQPEAALVRDEPAASGADREAAETAIEEGHEEVRED